MTGRVVPLDCGRDQWFWLSAVTTFSISIFLLWNYHCISVDGVRYIKAAKNFYIGDINAGLSSVYPPGYPLLIALFYNFVDDFERAAQWISVISRVLLLLPLYVLFHRMYSKQVAVVACFLAALSPFLAMYSVHVRTESLFFFLAASALCFFHRGMERQKVFAFFFGGLISGFAYLVRPEALGFVLLIPAVLLFFWWKQGRWSFTWVVSTSLALIGGFVIFAAPYVVYLSHETGEWGTVSRKAGITLAVGLREAGLMDEVAEEFTMDDSLSVPEFVAQQPWVYAKKIVQDIVPSVGIFFEAIHYSYVPFFLLGFILAFRERLRERKDLLLLAYLIFFMAGFTAIFVNRRYSVQMVPISMGWTALGVLSIWRLVTTRWNEKKSRVILMGLAAIFLATTLPKTLKPVSKEKAHLKEVGRYVRQLHGAGDLTIASSDRRVSYYADANSISLRSHSSESDVVAQLQQSQIEFVVADPKFLKRRLPSLLASPQRYGLQIEKEFVGPERDRMIVYRRI